MKGGVRAAQLRLSFENLPPLPKTAIANEGRSGRRLQIFALSASPHGPDCAFPRTLGRSQANNCRTTSFPSTMKGSYDE